MTCKLIVSDVDGCLAPEESASWDFARFARIVARVRGADGRASLPLTLCSGRPQPYVEALLKLLAVDLPAVCESGAVIYRLAGNESVYGPGVTPEGLREIGELRQFVTTDLLPLHAGAVLQFGKQAHVSVFSPDPARIPLLAAGVREFASRFPDDPFDISASHYYLNVSLRGVTKGSAIEQIMAELGVCREEVAAIGDTDGDLPLREHAVFFACPANATEAIRLRADYVSDRRDMDAIPEILDRIAEAFA